MTERQLWFPVCLSLSKQDEAALLGCRFGAWKCSLVPLAKENCPKLLAD